MTPHRRVKPRDLGNVLLRGPLASELTGEGFEHAHHLEHVECARARDGRDGRAAVRQQLHEAFGCEHLDRLAQRRAGYAEALREQALVQPVARLELALDDELSQTIRDLAVQRSRADRFDDAVKLHDVPALRRSGDYSSMS